jgi:hypothetical protein
MESSATVAVPPRPATRSGATVLLVVLEEDPAEPLGPTGDPHAANRMPTATANGRRENPMNE